MNTVYSKTLYTGLFFLFIFLSGFWLSRSGKPYHAVIFNVHKLIALGAVIFLAVTFYRMHQAAIFTPIQWIAIAAAGLLFITLMVTGGLLNIPRPMPAVLTVCHHLLPYLAVLSTGLAIYLLSLMSR